MAPREGKQRPQTLNRRAEGAPCMCTRANHGHDDEHCGHPVYGRTRGGKIKRICDMCAYKVWLELHPDEDPKLRHPTRQALRKARQEADQRAPFEDDSVTPGEDQTPVKPTPPSRRSPLSDPILDEPF